MTARYIGEVDLIRTCADKVRSHNAEAAMDAAIGAAGITRLIGYQVSKACHEGRLRTVLQGFKPEAMPVNLLYLGEGSLPLKTRAFIDFTVPRPRDRLTRARPL